MTIAVWQDEYYTGHDTIDQQHRDLFNRVNEIHGLIQAQPQEMGGIRQRLAAFARLAKEHFDLEETLMMEYRYPNFEVHCGTHRALVNKVQATLTKLDQGSGAPMGDVTQVMADWMVHHIRGEDQQMIRFFRSQPAAVAGAKVSG